MDMGDLREIFDYRDGHLFWKVKTCAKVVVGKLAGHRRPTGYWLIKHDGALNYAHRLVWIWHNGPIPGGLEVDHIDRDPSNNRIENLRLLTHAQNMANAGARSDSTTGVRGVYRLGPQYRNPFRATFRQRHLGTFATIEEAKAAHERASQSFIAGGM